MSGNRKNPGNKPFLQFVDEKGPWIIGFGGFILTVICAVFQTMGFTYVPCTSCFGAILLGLAIAFAYVYYLYRLTKTDPEHPEKRLGTDTFSLIMRNIGLVFLPIALFSFLATSYPAFLIGLCGMAYISGSMLVYLIFRARLRKADRS